LPIQGEHCTGILNHLVLEEEIITPIYWKTLQRPIQGMPGFAGRKPLENVPKITITGYPGTSVSCVL
jgi:hypothetical protein